MLQSNWDVKLKTKVENAALEREASDGENGLLYYSHVQTESECERREIKYKASNAHNVMDGVAWPTQ